MKMRKFFRSFCIRIQQDWRKTGQLFHRCLWPALAMVAIAACALAASERWADQPLIFWPSIGILAILPLLLVWLWAFTIPEIWHIPSKWLVLAGVTLPAMLGLSGQIWASELLNATFGEAPTLFPIAFLFGSYLGAMMGLGTRGAYIALGVLGLRLGLDLLRGLATPVMPGWEQGMAARVKAFGLNLCVGLSLVFLLASPLVIGLEFRHVVIKLAYAADFHANHHCDTAGWPQAVLRVAFIGDEQVLAQMPHSARPVVLSCSRIVGMR